MTAEKMMEILKSEYGIESRSELDLALKEFSGVDIGLFVSGERRDGDER